MQIVWLCIYKTIELKSIFKRRELSCESHVAHNNTVILLVLFVNCSTIVLVITKSPFLHKLLMDLKQTISILCNYNSNFKVKFWNRLQKHYWCQCYLFGQSMKLVYVLII